MIGHSLQLTSMALRMLSPIGIDAMLTGFFVLASLLSCIMAWKYRMGKWKNALSKLNFLKKLSPIGSIQGDNSLLLLLLLLYIWGFPKDVV